jgi:hypothetical protein
MTVRHPLWDQNADPATWSPERTARAASLAKAEQLRSLRVDHNGRLLRPTEDNGVVQVADPDGPEAA